MLLWTAELCNCLLRCRPQAKDSGVSGLFGGGPWGHWAGSGDKRKEEKGASQRESQWARGAQSPGGLWQDLDLS